MSLLAKLQAKKDAAVAEKAANLIETKALAALATPTTPEVLADPVPEPTVPKPELQAPAETEVIMGITLEDLQQRIAFVFEHAKTAEKHEIAEDMKGLQRAIMANPSIAGHLLPQDIGHMVAVLRKMHTEARSAASVTPAQKKATAAAEAKAVKEMLKKPLSKADLDDLLDEL